jgi:hypothetical protein
MKEKVMRCRYFVFALCVLLCSSSLPAATLIVDPTGGGDYTEIQPAIDAATEGGEGETSVLERFALTGGRIFLVKLERET